MSGDPSEHERSVARWAASGAMAITGRSDGPPLGPPAPLVPRLDEIAARLARRSTELGAGAAIDLDPLRLLAERAPIAGLSRHGDVSCGGATRLLRAADGWLAVALARDVDIELVPAWLELDGPPVDVWAAVAEQVAARTVDDVVERGVLLGLPVAALGSVAGPAGWSGLPVGARPVAPGRSRERLTGLLVVDLSSLWAGPLCTRLLRSTGARVVKVESRSRPDGARRGPSAFFDLLNRGKQSVALDLPAPDAVAQLRRLLHAADVVVEASRPRALEQLGIDAEEIVAAVGNVWVSITGYGRTGPARERVAFGDDAAVAGGLVVFDEDGPCFCADAVADPVTGLVAATAAVEAMCAGGGWILDVAMAGVAAHLAGPTLPVPAGTVAAVPVAPVTAGAPARPMGADTEAVLARVGSPA